MKNDFELFKGKSLSSLFQDIYVNQNQKKKRISELINDIRALVKTPHDMPSVGPVLSGLLETSVRNDEQLLKLAQIAQKIMMADNKSEGQDGFLSAAEKEQLLKDFQDIKSSDITSDEVDELQNELEELHNIIK
jgi:lysophospholipase L1-like esterase